MDDLNVHTTGLKQDLPITLGTELLIELADLKLKLRSELIGIEKGKYVIVKMPEQELGFSIDALQSSSIIIRYLHKGTVYGFKTRIIHHIETPARLLFVTCPSKLEEFKVRNNPRYECMLPAQAKFGEVEAEMIIIDISQKGCRGVVNAASVKYKERLYHYVDVDKKVALKAQLPGTEEKIAISGVIKNFNKDDYRLAVGVMFEDIEACAKAKLESFMSLISAARE